jgi:hypothetical protein
VPSGATEFLAAVGCWRYRRLTAKRRRHGGVRRSESRQTASPSANDRALGQGNDLQLETRLPRRSAPLAGEVAATREAWVSSLVGRKANRPSSEDSRSRIGNLDARLPFGRSRLADSRAKQFARPANRPPEDHTRDYDQALVLVRERMPGSHPQPRLNRVLRRMAAVNQSAARPPMKNIGQSHHGRLQRSLGPVSSTFAPLPGPRSSGRGWHSIRRGPSKMRLA